MSEFFSISDLRAILPELFLCVFGLFVILFDLFIPRERKRYVAAMAFIGVMVSLALVIFYSDTSYGAAFGGMYQADAFANFIKLIVLMVAALVILLSIRYLEIEGANIGEYYVVVLFATAGMMFMAGSTDLVSIYISLELMSISIYILAGFLKTDPKSNESSVKYFILGAFSSGVLLYGMSFLYGVTGTTRIDGIRDALMSTDADAGTLLFIGIIFTAAGLFFKIAAVPFHVWVPDVYEGAPTSITAFMSTAPKAAAFAIFLRIFVSAIWPLRLEWLPMIAVVSALTMTLGNIVAIAQNNMKRMLAYSSIAHAGYLLLGFLSGDRAGLTAVLVYLLIYAFMNVGAFSMVIALRRKNIIGDQVEDFKGLARRNQAAAAVMLIFMLSLTGIPPLAGFVGKFYLFFAAIRGGFMWLAIVAAINSAISLYYYMRPVVYMYMGEAEEDEPYSFSPELVVVLGVAVVFTLLIGLYPSPFFEAAGAAAVLPIR